MVRDITLDRGVDFLPQNHSYSKVISISTVQPVTNIELSTALVKDIFVEF